MNYSLLQKVKAAAAKDPSVICAPENLDSAPGYSEAYFQFLGLDAGDLKSLEARKLAIRGYKDFHSGRQVRWTLVTQVPTEEAKSSG